MTKIEIKGLTENPMFAPTEVLIDGREAVAVKWTGDNFYSLRKVASDVIEMIEKPICGQFNIALKGFENGDILAREISKDRLGYDHRRLDPDLSEYELIHIREGEYEIVTPKKEQPKKKG